MPDAPFFSLHQGMMTDGRNFTEFLGGNEFDRVVVSKFDDFLQESFGERTFKRLVEWTLMYGNMTLLSR